MEDVVGRVVAPGLGVSSMFAGLFAIGAPLVAWAASIGGVVLITEPDATVQWVGMCAVLGAQVLAVLSLLAVPAGALAAIVGGPIAHLHGRSIVPAVLGLLLNLAAPMTWLLTWVGMIALVRWSLRDYGI